MHSLCRSKVLSPFASGSKASKESRADSQLIQEGLEDFLEEAGFELRPKSLVSAVRPIREEW